MNEIRNRRITIRFTNEEHAALLSSAEAMGMTISQFVRFLSKLYCTTSNHHTDETPSITTFQRGTLVLLNKELRRWGHHYNQGIRALNEINLHVRSGRSNYAFLHDECALIHRQLDRVVRGTKRMTRSFNALHNHIFIEES